MFLVSTETHPAMTASETITAREAVTRVAAKTDLTPGVREIVDRALAQG